MGKGFTGYDEVQLIDDEVFTRERVEKWRDYMFDSYKVVYGLLREKIASDAPIGFFASESLINEVVVDAVIGMRKITDSDNNDVVDPNTFKIASYLAYWWLRHKPVSIHYPRGFMLEDIQIKEKPTLTADENGVERMRMVWYLKHVNELVAVQAASSYLFDFSEEACGNSACRRVVKANNGNFAFDNFGDMKDEMIDTLIYYFAYRAIAPKIIEQILEACTFHPAYVLNGKLWDNGKSA